MPFPDDVARVVRSIPRGTVATYGQVALAAGYPGAARRVAKVLRDNPSLPWQRVLGSGGAIKLRGPGALEQRLQLEMEGVRFRGRRVDIEAHRHALSPWQDTESPAVPQSVTVWESTLPERQDRDEEGPSTKAAR